MRNEKCESKGICLWSQVLQKQGWDWNQGVSSQWQCPAVMSQWEMKTRGLKMGSGRRQVADSNQRCGGRIQAEEL